MRLPGRISAAIDILADLNQRQRPVSLALKDWGLSHRFAGSGDRAAIGNLVYDVQRKKLSHAYAMQSDDPRALVLAVAVRDWGHEAAALNASFSEDNFAPDAITDAESSVLTSDDPVAGAPDHVRADLPEWLADGFKVQFGDNWIEEAEAFATRPPLDMRINTIKSTPERVAKGLKRFSPQSTGYVDYALRIPPAPGERRQPNVQADEAYQKGWFEVQDLGSQMAARLVNAEAGHQVLDFCAGAGGKSLALAAAMGNKGQVIAHDADRNRLAPIYDRIKRSGAHNIQVRPPEPDALHDLVGRMDKVLIDAPCTGTGTWRRHPDTKWRLSPDQLRKRVEEQSAILADAGRYLKPGGELIYVTCSVLEAENRFQIQQLVANSGLYSPVDMRNRWVAAFPLEAPSALVSETGVTLSPRSTGTDGFFISALTKRQNA